MPPHRPRTIVITGGIVSGIGKGITAASLGRLLIDAGFSVQPVKADPYLNKDAGTMNPFQHGEVFVTQDGAETDLDLGHYERFLDVDLTRYANFTSGAVYQAVMDLEREGEYLGKTIQLLPHVTDEIIRRISKAGEQSKPDFLICEVGGTVGDLECPPFLEAIRQYGAADPANTLYVHVVKMDYLYPSGEGKTKPIQFAVTTLRSYGIQPHMLVIRCNRDITKEEREKIATFTGVKPEFIIQAIDVESLYDIPRGLSKHGFDKAVLASFNLKPPKNTPGAWDAIYQKMAKRKRTLRVGLVGKYIENDDAYLSVLEAIKHAGIYHQVFTEIVPINSETADIDALVPTLDAMIVPGGFGSRGIEGKIRAIQLARENKIPYLGICLGLQTAVIEIARHLGGLKDANSSEFAPKGKNLVIDIMAEQATITRKGGTMRLGNYPARLKSKSLAEEIYKDYRPKELKGGVILERHRHRYEVNPKFHAALTKTGLIFSGMSPDRRLVEFIELPKEMHPYFIATQAHPEFRSRPHRPHPLFAGLIEAAL